MKTRAGAEQERNRQTRGAVGVKIVCALFCLSLIMSAPYDERSPGGWVGVSDASAAPGDVQDGEPAGSANDDTPNQDDIEDFASEFDQDGDGEIDEPAEEEDDEPADEPEEEDAGEEDDQDDQDDQDDDDDEHDDDDDGQGNWDDDDDSGSSLNSREDIDRDASPDYRVSGFNRYAPEKKLRRLGDISELTPLIQREEELLFEN